MYLADKTIFKIPERVSSLFDMTPSLMLYKDFKDLGYREMAFVIFYADYMSPYRYLWVDEDMDDRDRRKIIVDFLGIKAPARILSGKHRGVEKAIKFYEKLRGHSNLLMYKSTERSIIDIYENSPVQGEDEANEKYMKRVTDWTKLIKELEKNNVLANIQERIHSAESEILDRNKIGGVEYHRSVEHSLAKINEEGDSRGEPQDAHYSPDEF